MKHNKGFTLLELLIAAVIIGALAVLATNSYRKTASDVRVQDAIARAKVVAMAAKRFAIDHPTFSMQKGGEYPMGEVNRTVACDITAPIALTLQQLVSCGYLEYRQYAAELRESDGPKSNFKMYFDDREEKDQYVCIKGTSSKITTSTVYCTDGEIVEEVSAS